MSSGWIFIELDEIPICQPDSFLRIYIYIYDEETKDSSMSKLI